MPAYTSLHSLAWVVSAHYVIDPVPADARGVLDGNRIPADIAERRLVELIEREPRLIKSRVFPANPYIKIHALSDQSLLDNDITWKLISLPCAEVLGSYYEDGCHRYFDDWCRDFAAEQEYARIAGDAIVASSNCWQR